MFGSGMHAPRVCARAPPSLVSFGHRAFLVAPLAPRRLSRLLSHCSGLRASALRLHRDRRLRVPLRILQHANHTATTLQMPPAPQPAGAATEQAQRQKEHRLLIRTVCQTAIRPLDSKDEYGDWPRFRMDFLQRCEAIPGAIAALDDTTTDVPTPLVAGMSVL